MEFLTRGYTMIDFVKTFTEKLGQQTPSAGLFRDYGLNYNTVNFRFKEVFGNIKKLPKIENLP